MKRSVLSAIITLVTGLSLQAAGPVTLAKWTFETSLPTTAGPLAPEVGSGAATGGTGGVYSSLLGNGSAASWSSTAWNVGDYFQFQTSSLGGRTAIQISFDQTGSTTGPRDFVLQYSTDGNSFTAFGSTYAVLFNGAPNNAWNSTTEQPIYNFSYDLSSVTALNNAATIYFRLVNNSTSSINNGTTAANGSDRVDNVTISAVPEPQSLFIVGGLGILAWTFVNRRK